MAERADQGLRDLRRPWRVARRHHRYLGPGRPSGPQPPRHAQLGKRAARHAYITDLVRSSQTVTRPRMTIQLRLAASIARVRRAALCLTRIPAIAHPRLPATPGARVG